MSTIAVVLTGPPGAGKSSVLEHARWLAGSMHDLAAIDIRVDTDVRTPMGVAVELRELLRHHGFAP